MTAGVKLILLISVLIVPSRHTFATEQTPETLRKLFLLAEQYIYQDRDNDYFTVADSLKNYPLYPYLQYQWLKKNLDSDQAVQQFLTNYDQSRYSKLLRPRWLKQLGKKQQWQTFLTQYRHTDDLELQCYYTQAQYQNGQTQSALNNIRQLWLTGKSLPAACDIAISYLKITPIYTTDLVWQRFQAALAEDNLPLANAMQALLSEPEQSTANLWLKLHQQPALLNEDADWKHNYPLAGLLFAHAIGRWLDSNPVAALQTWEAEKQNYSIPADQFTEIEKQLGVALAIKRDTHAFEKLLKISNKDAATREWTIRAALNQQNWQQVSLALNELNEEEKRLDKWQYWQARTLSAQGQSEAALEIYQELAKNRSFYGYLAAAQLQLTPTLTDTPLQVSEADLRQLAQQPEFLVANELLAINRKQEAKHQWWYAITYLDKHNLIIAAKLAQIWKCPALAIFTIAKANEWDDMNLRFPLQYAPEIQDIANTQQLDPALIYGLIRQESAFDEFADSPAGAKGLMQIMPKTAKQIAMEFNEKWDGETGLFNPVLNIRYGSYYYKKLLQQFNGNHSLAIAAYNAGPNRVKRWLPDSKTLPGDIWIETIPYKETRTYLSSVMLYTFIYQQRLQRNSLNPTNLIINVSPG